MARRYLGSFWLTLGVTVFSFYLCAAIPGGLTLDGVNPNLVMAGHRKTAWGKNLLIVVLRRFIPGDDAPGAAQT